MLPSYSNLQQYCRVNIFERRFEYLQEFEAICENIEMYEPKGMRNKGLNISLHLPSKAYTFSTTSKHIL